MSQVYGITIQKYNNLWSLKHKKSRQLQKQTAKIKIYKTLACWVKVKAKLNRKMYKQTQYQPWRIRIVNKIIKINQFLGARTRMKWMKKIKK